MPSQHTPPRRQKIDKSGILWRRHGLTPYLFPCLDQYAPFAQNRENFTFRYFLGSSRNSFRSRRRSPATPLMLS